MAAYDNVICKCDTSKKLLIHPCLVLQQYVEILKGRDPPSSPWCFFSKCDARFKVVGQRVNFTLQQPPRSSAQPTAALSRLS